MGLEQETWSFFIFIAIGMVYAFIFDFFRALRKIKKVNTVIVSIQDIIYFIIVGIILVIVMYGIMQETLRIYLIFSIILGVMIYTSIFGNSVRNIYIKIIRANNKILEFIFIPLDIFRQIFSKQLKFLKNITKFYCKKFFYVIKSNYCKVRPKKKAN